MKILVIALAFNPRDGSEASIGWRAVQALLEHHHVHVLCHAKNRKVFADIQTRDFPKNLKISYVGEATPYHPNMLIAKILTWVGYRRWLEEAFALALELREHDSFDLAHHITFATWRVGSPFYGLGIPFVWGPVGGGGRVPWRFFLTLQFKTMAFEGVRNIAQVFGKLGRSVRNCTRLSSAVVAAEAGTCSILKDVAGKRCGQVHIAPLTYFSEADLKRFESGAKNFDGPLRLVAGGGIIGSKGYMVAFRALKIAQRRGLRFTYEIAGYGTEKPFLMRQVAKMGLSDVVIFHDFLAGDDYRRFLDTAHIFLLPTFREAFCVTLAEAMAAGNVPIVADASAPSEIVDIESGFKIPVTTPEKMATDIADTLITLDENRILLAKLSIKARRRIAGAYSQTGYLRSIEQIYGFAIESHKNAVQNSRGDTRK